MIMPTLMRYKLKDKSPMLARYARRVCKIDEADDAVAAEKAIAAIEHFMVGMGCPVRISQAGITIDADELVAPLERAGQTALGERQDVTPAAVREILAQAA